MVYVIGLRELAENIGTIVFELSNKSNNDFSECSKHPLIGNAFTIRLICEEWIVMLSYMDRTCYHLRSCANQPGKLALDF